MAIVLPEREYFTFSELAQRWECNENDIRRLVISQQIIPSYLINHVAFLVRLIESEEEEGGEKIWVPEQVENENYHLHDGDKDQASFKYKQVFTNGFYYLLHPWQTAPLSCQFTLFSKERDHKEDSGDTCFMQTLHGEKGRPITLDQVLQEGAVMRCEVERYERCSEKMQMESPQISQKPLQTTERNTLLTIIAALAKQAKIDIKETGKSAQYISGLTDELGANVSKRAIEEHLKKIPNAMATRMK